MIDINELRQSAQSATPGPWYIGSGTHEGRNIYSVEAVTDDEGFTYNPVVATAEDDDVVCWEANARLIAAANPAVISELLDRLEAAETDAAHQKALAESALRVAEGWERKCGELRAKIAEMEQQEPVAWMQSTHLSSFKNRLCGSQSSYVHCSDHQLHPDFKPLYALPGAQEQEPTRDWWDCLIADISAIDCMYRGSPTYAHDAYWMRDHVVRMLKKRRDSLPGAKGE